RRGRGRVPGPAGADDRRRLRADLRPWVAPPLERGGRDRGARRGSLLRRAQLAVQADPAAPDAGLPQERALADRRARGGYALGLSARPALPKRVELGPGAGVCDVVRGEPGAAGGGDAVADVRERLRAVG